MALKFDNADVQAKYSTNEELDRKVKVINKNDDGSVKNVADCNFTAISLESADTLYKECPGLLILNPAPKNSKPSDK